MANIMIVDDSIIMRKNLKTILNSAGHTVIGEATNGLQAYNDYKNLMPDLVTMDITMPVMDGVQCTKKIINEYPDAKIIMISALDQKNMVFQALENGAKHYIIKPIVPDNLLRVINEVLMFNRLDDYSRELGSKDEALDNMWVEIKESKDEIVDLNKSLEDIVEERTSQLENANRKLKDTLGELKATQEKLIQSEKSAALAGMVAGVAHEINTPIGLCITTVSYLEETNKDFSDLYKNGSLKKSELEKFLNTVNEATNLTLINLRKASDLVRSFKQVAVDQSSEQERVFYLKAYINDVLLSLRPELKKRNCNININCDDSLTIKSFPGVFSQIITNLVMNTLIHGYEEGENVKINFNITKGNGNLLFEYFDEGKGIKKDIQDKIFDPFFTTKRGNGGTGLGLNIVNNLVVNNLNGTIKCESEEGNGTAFIINIPVSE